MNAEPTQQRTWTDWLVLGLILGYYAMSRSFAHWGVPPVFYIGELSLAAIFFFRPQALVAPWLQGMLHGGRLSAVAWLLSISVAYGLFEAARGVMIGYSTLDAAKNIVFHVYPFFVFPGIWVGLRHRDELAKLAVPFAWLHGVYGVLFITLFSWLGLTDAAEDADFDYVGVFGQPFGAAAAILALLAFQSPRLGRVWAPLAMNLFVLGGMQVRAAWLAFTVAVTLWAALSRQLRLLAAAALWISLLFVAALISDVEIPGPATRGGVISARNFVGRSIAAFDARLASRLSDHSEQYSANVSWRTEWWNSIVATVHQEPESALFGLAYGYPLWRLHPFDLNDDWAIRTPHNVWVYALGYTGWIGLLLFVALQLAIGAMLWRCYQVTGQAFGVGFWLMCLIWATFDNYFETPYSAIPFYLVVGMALAPLFQSPSSSQIREVAQDA